MALINCPECGKSISDKAETCPECGSPVKEKSAFTKNLGCGGVLFALLLLTGLVIGIGGASIGWLVAAIGLLLLAVRLKMWSGTGKK